MSKVITREDLKELFNKSYGEEAPSKQKWRKYYNDDVIIIFTQYLIALIILINVHTEYVILCFVV